MSHWNQKVVVVTGGSEGLGKSIATAFGQRGAIVVLLARDETKLQAAAAELTKLNLKVTTVVGDVTDDASVQQAVDRVLGTHAHIDVWINNVGKSTRASALDCSIELYQELMELNFYSAVRCTRAVLPQLETTGGSLVNVGSLASKTAWPLMAPYSASKHALAAFTQQMRLEGPANVNFLHVCPGPIRRTDAGARYDEEATKLSSAARKPGAGAKLKGLDPAVLSEQIVTACERRQIELVLPASSKLLFTIAQISPRLGDWLLRRFTPDESSKST